MKKIYKYILAGLVGLGISLSIYAIAAPTPVNLGGTGNSNIPVNSLLYGSSTNQSLQILPPGPSGYVLQSLNGIPTFVATSTLGIIGGSGSPAGVTGQIQYNNSGAFGAVATGTQGTFLGNSATNTPGWFTPYTVTVGPSGSGSNYIATGTNDQIGINAATQAVASSTGGGMPLIKAGNYITNQSINLPSNVSLQGEGPATLINVATPYVGHPIGGAGIHGTSTFNSIIQNLHLDGLAQTTTPFQSDRLIGLSKSHNINITNNLLTNAQQFGVFVEDQPISGGLSNGSSTGISIQNNYISCLGGQDCIGGGPHVSNGASEVSDINILGNFIQQTINQGGTENTNFDANCLDIVRALRVNFSENNCFGNVVFGSEQTPHQFSAITNNILSAPLGTTTVADDIAIQQNNSGSSSATRTPTNLLVAGNLVQQGTILLSGIAVSPIQNLLVYGNSLRTATSTAQDEGGGKNGINASQIAYSSIFGNDLTASAGASGVTGIKLSNASNTVVSLNTIRNFTTGIDLGNGPGNKSIFNNFEGITNPVINGSNIIGMDDNGHVYIGTTTANSQLTVQGDIFATGNISCGGTCGGGSSASGTLGNIQFSGGSGAFNSNNLFNWDNSLKLLSVGTTTPGYSVDIYNTVGTNDFRAFNATGPSSSGGGGLVGASPLPTAANQRLGFLLFGGVSTSSPTTTVNSTGIAAFSSESWIVGSNQGSYLTFATTPIASTSRNTDMTILGNGNVGIGTASPSNLLTVAGTSSTQSLILPNIISSILATDANGNVIATTTSAGGIISVSGSGSILSSGGTTPTIQLQTQTANDVLFGQGTNIIATSSGFTFAAGTLTVPGIAVSSSTATSTFANAVVIGTTNTTQDNLLRITPQGTYSNSTSQGGAVNIDNSLNAREALVIYQGTNAVRNGGAGQLRISNASTTYSSGELYINSTSTSGADSDIEIVSPNPDIEMYGGNLGTASSTQSFEMAVPIAQNVFQINSRNSANSSFENVATFQEYQNGGRFCLGCKTNDSTQGLITVVGTSTIPYLTLGTSATDASIMSVLSNGNTGLGSSTPTDNLVIQGVGNQANNAILTVASSTGASLVTIGVSSTNGQQLSVNASTTINSVVYIGGSTVNPTFPLFTVASSSGVTYLQIDQWGHKITGGAFPTCGTGCNSVTGDDSTFRTITGTGVTAVTVNFAHTYTTTPVCVSSDESGGTTVSDASSTPSSVTMNLSASLTTKSIGVICQVSANFTN